VWPLAPSRPSTQCRMAPSWPKSLDILFGGAKLVARRAAEINEGKFQIRVFAAGEIRYAIRACQRGI